MPDRDQPATADMHGRLMASNLYLAEVDRMLERAKETTRYGKYTYVEYARFADDLMILIDAHPRHDWLMGVRHSQNTLSRTIKL
jgi:hypothetical protein